jgi:hypothetical protein
VPCRRVQRLLLTISSLPSLAPSWPWTADTDASRVASSSFSVSSATPMTTVGNPKVIRYRSRCMRLARDSYRVWILSIFSFLWGPSGRYLPVVTRNMTYNTYYTSVQHQRGLSTSSVVSTRFFSCFPHSFRTRGSTLSDPNRHFMGGGGGGAGESRRENGATCLVSCSPLLLPLPLTPAHSIPACPSGRLKQDPRSRAQAQDPGTKVEGVPDPAGVVDPSQRHEDKRNTATHNFFSIAYAVVTKLTGIRSRLHSEWKLCQQG